MTDRLLETLKTGLDLPEMRIAAVVSEIRRSETLAKPQLALANRFGSHLEDTKKGRRLSSSPLFVSVLMKSACGDYFPAAARRATRYGTGSLPSAFSTVPPAVKQCRTQSGLPYMSNAVPPSPPPT